MLLMAALLSLASCNVIDKLFTRSAVKQPKPFVQEVSDTAVTPDVAPNGWKPVRSTPTEILWLPPLVQPGPKKVKIKNSHNTDNSQKKSNNVETKQKGVSNTKAKGDGIVGNDNAPVEATKQAVVGDSNKVEQEEQNLLWVWCLLALVSLYLCWPRLRKYLPL